MLMAFLVLEKCLSESEILLLRILNPNEKGAGTCSS